MRRVSLMLLGVLLAAAVAAPASGVQEEAAAPAEPRTSEPHGVRLTLGTGVTLGLTDMEERGSDTVSTWGNAYRWNVSLAPSWPLTRTWALGARGSWSSDAGARGSESSSLWQLGAELRHQPRGWLGPYLAASLGGAAARNSNDSETVTQWAPAVGAAVGYDLGIAESWALGLELRAGAALFDGEGASLRSAQSETVTFVYGATSWLSLNLTGQLRL